MACTVCLAALQELRNAVRTTEDGAILVHHGSMAGLAESSAQGCPFCAVFWDQYLEPEKANLLDGDREDLLASKGLPSCDDQSTEALILQADVLKSCATMCYLESDSSFSRRQDIGVPNTMGYSILLGMERKLPPVGQRKDMAMFLLKPSDSDIQFRAARSSSTRSQESWSLAEGWLARCLESHQRCNSAQNQRWLPTRLLDLAHSETKSTVRLVNSADIAPTERYTTLSHRWGSHVPYCLNRNTEPSLRAGIWLKELPHAFRDAIEICQRLHISYMWIDSLCILQDKDDLRDWIKEAALMHKVYSHSYLNISALAANDSSESFFVERRPDVIETKYVTTRLQKGKLGLNPIRYGIIDMLWLYTTLTHAPLNLRAWVLQERLLAPRVLHFGHEQLVWECHETECAESYPEGLPPEMAMLKDARFKSLDAQSESVRMQHVRKGDSAEMAPYRLWDRIVEAYTKCGITKSEDKLIAIAGIAKHMAVMLEDEYVCGMWRKYLASALLWRVEEQLQIDDRPSFRPKQYRAPSFSWASVEGMVRPHDPSETGLLIEVQHIDLDFATEDKTGMIKGGSLLLKGQVQALSLRKNTPRLSNLIMSVNGIEARAGEGPEWERLGPMLHFDEHESYFDPLKADQQALFCIPAHLWGDKRGRFLSVLLLQVVDPQQGTYRRFGIADAHTQCQQDVIQRRPEQPVDAPCVAIEGGMHIIRLI